MNSSIIPIIVGLAVLTTVIRREILMSEWFLFRKKVTVKYKLNCTKEDRIMSIKEYLKLMDDFHCPRFSVEDLRNMDSLELDLTGQDGDIQLAYFKVVTKKRTSRQVSYARKWS